MYTRTLVRDFYELLACFCSTHNWCGWTTYDVWMCGCVDIQHVVMWRRIENYTNKSQSSSKILNSIILGFFFYLRHKGSQHLKNSVIVRLLEVLVAIDTRQKVRQKGSQTDRQADRLIDGQQNEPMRVPFFSVEVRNSKYHVQNARYLLCTIIY